MNKNKLIKGIKEYPNPYPKDIFVWDNKEAIKLNRGRFNEFIYNVVENTRNDIIKIIVEVEEDGYNNKRRGKTKMKKIIGIIGMMLLLFSIVVIAETEEEYQERMYQERMKPIWHEESLSRQKMLQQGGDGSFLLKKNKSLFGLKSEYDGMGFGLTFGKYINYGLKLNFYQTNLRSMTIYPERNTLNNLNAVHYKQIPTKKYKDLKSIESYEILSTLNDSQIKYYNFVFRTDKKITNPYVVIQNKNNPIVIYESEKLIMLGHTQNYWSINVDEIGVMTIVSNN